MTIEWTTLPFIVIVSYPFAFRGDWNAQFETAAERDEYVAGLLDKRTPDTNSEKWYRIQLATITEEV